MKRLILLAVVLAVGVAAAGWRGRFDEQFAASVAEAEWTPAALGPIAWYKGENDALTSAGAFSGTWNGMATYAAGKIGMAFDTSAQNTITTSLTLPAGALTFSAWVKQPSIANSEAICGAGYLAGGVAGSGMYMQPTKYGMQTRTGASVYSVDCDYGGGTGWSHLVGMRTGTQMMLFTNGVLASTLDCPVAPASVLPFEIGRRNYTSYEFTGQIDDVLIFDRALTPTEIKLLYDESVKRSGRAW